MIDRFFCPESRSSAISKHLMRLRKTISVLHSIQNRFCSYFIAIPIPLFFLITLALMAGIGTQAQGISFMARYALTACCSCLALTPALAQRERFNTCILALTLCALSFLTGSLLIAKKIYDYNDIKQAINNRYIDIKGTVIDITDRQGRYKQMITIALAQVLCKEKPPLYASSYRAMLYCKDPIAVVRGDRIDVKNLFCFQSPTIAPHKNNYYAMRDNVVAHFFINKSTYTITKGDQSCIARSLYYWKSKRHELNARIKQKLASDTYSLFASLFLGAPSDHSQHSQDLRKDFTYWGITHYLARSGLHVAMVLVVWQSLLRLIPLSLKLKELFLLMILALYTLLSWSSVSFTRAILSYTLARSCLLASFPLHPFQTIALPCFMLLCYNPYHLFFLSFQLSFGLAFALTWLNEIELLKRRLYTNHAT